MKIIRWSLNNLRTIKPNNNSEYVSGLNAAIDLTIINVYVDVKKKKKINDLDKEFIHQCQTECGLHPFIDRVKKININVTIKIALQSSRYIVFLNKKQM